VLPAWSTVGLKEWAVTVAALEKGEQVFLMRKGGIREPERSFKIEHDGFFLYPTYDHQSDALVKPEHRNLSEETAAQEDADLVHLSSYAEVIDVLETSDEAAIASLHDHHIGTSEYAGKRLRWKPTFPMTIITLRVHLLEQPQALPVMDSYVGCKSWVEFVEEYPVGVSTPVLNDRRFDQRVDAVKSALNQTTNA
jgi:hypothetical protein